MEKRKEKSEDRPLIRYEKLSKEDLVDYCRVYWRRIHNDEVLFNEIYKDIEKLKEENKKLKAAATMYRNDCKKLRAENEYLHKLLPEADGYIIEKQMEQRLWNDGEEDVYEDWGE